MILKYLDSGPLSLCEQFSFVSSLQALSSGGLSLVFTEKNLIDQVWEEHGRPDPPTDGLMVLDISFTG